MTSQPDTEQQRQTAEVASCFFELIAKIISEAEQLAQRIGIPTPFIKALHSMDCPLAMKELGRRMHCDPSFVTLVADMLEKRGLARREPHPADRRIKNLVLTDDGLALKHTIEAEITARMPWNRSLDDSERAQLLALIRKMLRTDADGAPATGAVTPDALHGAVTSMLVSALQDSALQDVSAPVDDSAAQTAEPRDAGRPTSPHDDRPATRVRQSRDGEGEVTRVVSDSRSAR